MKRNNEGKAIVLALAIGTPIYLLMEHPLIFFAIFLPILILLVVSFIGWLKR